MRHISTKTLPAGLMYLGLNGVYPAGVDGEVVSEVQWVDGFGKVLEDVNDGGREYTQLKVIGITKLDLVASGEMQIGLDGADFSREGVACVFDTRQVNVMAKCRV